MKRPQAGFTVVELLVVIVVIAILAAISIVAYTGIQGRAHDAAVQSDLRSISQSIMIYHADTGLYPRVSDFPAITAPTTNPRISMRTSQNSYSQFYFCHAMLSSGDHYAIIAQSRSGNSFYISNTQTTVTPLPTTPQAAGYICSNTAMSDTPMPQVFEQLDGLTASGWANWIR